jgi:hypothetical protein
MISSTDTITQAHESQEEAAAAESSAGCGCAPRRALAARPSDAQRARVEPEDTNAGPSTGPDTLTRRELKLVVLVRACDSGYRAHLFAGSEGCDLELRVTDTPDLSAALLA